MTDELNELRKIAESATPGPWHHAETGVLGAREDWDLGRGPARIMAAQMPWRRERMEANAEHVATFDPPTVLALLSRLEQVEQAVQRVREAALADLKCPCCSGYEEILRILDSDTRRLADQGLGGGQGG